MISFRQVADQRPDAGSGSGEPHETADGRHAVDQARHELWPEPAPHRPVAPLPRYRRLGD